MSRRSKSTLFLIEQLIVVAVFAICAAACVRILTASYFMATEANDMSNAVRVAESGAESYKAVSGDMAKTAEILEGNSVIIDGEAGVIVYYDNDWRVCGEADAYYVLRLVSLSDTSGPQSLLSGELSVGKLSGEEIIAFPVAARGG